MRHTEVSTPVPGRCTLGTSPSLPLYFPPSLHLFLLLSLPFCVFCVFFFFAFLSSVLPSLLPPTTPSISSSFLHHLSCIFSLLHSPFLSFLSFQHPSFYPIVFFLPSYFVLLPSPFSFYLSCLISLLPSSFAFFHSLTFTHFFPNFFQSFLFSRSWSLPWNTIFPFHSFRFLRTEQHFFFLPQPFSSSLCTRFLAP